MTLPLSIPRFATLATAMLAAALVFAPGNATALSTKESVACSNAKQKAALKALAAMIKCNGTASKKGESLDPACLAEAQEKLSDGFAAAEGKGGCLTTSDAGAVSDLMEQTLQSLLQQLPAASCSAETCVDCVACSQAGGGPCADELATLLTTTGGEALLTCTNACADSACVNNCFASHPAAVGPFVALSQCIFVGTCTVCSSCSCGDGACVEGCGESTASCPLDCVDCASSCGNGACNASCGETASTCPGDCCAPVCGDGTCDAGCGETIATCAGDCAPAGCYPTPSSGGCAGCACEASVCAADPYCCDTSWDEACTRACKDSGLVACGATPSLCSEGSAPSCGGDCGFAGSGKTCQPTSGYCLTSLYACSVDSDCQGIEPLVEKCIHCSCQ